LSFKILRPALSRRSLLAAASGLAAGSIAGNRARAQDIPEMPDAADTIRRTTPIAAPNLQFTDATGRKLKLSDYRGAGLVVDVWATWCGPCVAEFPSLAALAPKLAPAKIFVLPISIDMGGLDVVRAFYLSRHIKTLPILLDPQGNAMNALNTSGIPITIIVNPTGQIVAHTLGAANWNTPRTIRLLHTLIAPPPTPGPQAGFQPV
jgi:thiol-disulfide isomerase/thioredoxin